jgi:hypothetical protein
MWVTLSIYKIYVSRAHVTYVMIFRTLDSGMKVEKHLVVIKHHTCYWIDQERGRGLFVMWGAKS